MYINGEERPIDSNKRTYEIISHLGLISSYSFADIPAYYFNFGDDGTLQHLIRYQAIRREDLQKHGTIRALLYVMDMNSFIAPAVTFILGIGIVGGFVIKYIGKARKAINIAKEALDVANTVIESLEVKAGETK